jgi:hypothetical protein
MHNRIGTCKLYIIIITYRDFGMMMILTLLLYLLSNLIQSVELEIIIRKREFFLGISFILD